MKQPSFETSGFPVVATLLELRPRAQVLDKRSEEKEEGIRIPNGNPIQPCSVPMVET